MPQIVTSSHAARRSAVAKCGENFLYSVKAPATPAEGARPAGGASGAVLDRADVYESVHPTGRRPDEVVNLGVALSWLFGRAAPVTHGDSPVVARSGAG